jgi:3-methylcrotonyl-CoA carboxylase alpha subunit
VLLDDAQFEISMSHTTSGQSQVFIDGVHAGFVYVAGTDERRFVCLDGEVYEVSVLEPLAVHARAAASAGGLEARAPMPGNVVAVPVAVGDAVRAGDTLVIIESMKLEVAIKAPQAGLVAEIRCEVGRGFDKDAVLVMLSADVEG